jgi:tRNA A37 threonylcarbamoyltransferase TsaD
VTHTQIVKVNDFLIMTIIGETTDDAVGSDIKVQKY